MIDPTFEHSRKTTKVLTEQYSESLKGAKKAEEHRDKDAFNGYITMATTASQLQILLKGLLTDLENVLQQFADEKAETQAIIERLEAKFDAYIGDYEYGMADEA